MNRTHTVKHFARGLLAVVSFVLILFHASEAAMLTGCFDSPATYNADWSYELSSTENQKGKTITPPGLALIGAGPMLTAQCDCSKAGLNSSSVIADYIYATTNLSAGVKSSYGYLTDKIDVHIDTYTNSAGASDASSLVLVPIGTYPTSTPVSKSEPQTSKESIETVCKQGTQPVSGTPSRQFSWNVIAVTYYIKSPILGQEIIPPTPVVNISACVYSGSGCSGGSSGSAQPVSTIYLSGTLSAPLSCTINAGGIIDVEFGNIISSNFSHQGTPPDGFALKDIDITFHCDANALGNTDKIKLTLTADQGVSDGDSALIAKMIGRDDLGVRMYDDNSNNIRLDGGTVFPISLDSQGNGSIKMKAAPVPTTDNRPEPGKFEGNVTVKMDVK